MADRQVVELEPNVWGDRPPEGPSFNWIADYLKQLRLSCWPGMQLLVMGGPFDDQGDSPPRAARVRGNRVRIADLLTGYELVGPQEVPVDQAFLWVSEGAGSAALPK